MLAGASVTFCSKPAAVTTVSASRTLCWLARATLAARRARVPTTAREPGRAVEVCSIECSSPKGTAAAVGYEYRVDKHYQLRHHTDPKPKINRKLSKSLVRHYAAELKGWVQDGVVGKVPWRAPWRSLETAFDTHVYQNLGGDLFHREMRRVDVRDILAAEQVFHLANLEFALGETGIAAVGATLIANARQPVRVDGQPEQLVLVRTQRCGELQALHIIVRQWVVGRADTVLQCHIEAGRRFAAPGYPHQNDVRFLVMVGPCPVIVIHGEVHGIDAVLIVAVVLDGVGLADRIGGTGAQLLLQWSKEGREDVDDVTLGLGQFVVDGPVDDSLENDRALTICLGSGIDLLYHVSRFFNGINIGAQQLAELYVLELREQALPQCLSGDTSSIGNEKSGAFHARSLKITEFFRVRVSNPSNTQASKRHCGVFITRRPDGKACAANLFIE